MEKLNGNRARDLDALTKALDAQVCAMQADLATLRADLAQAPGPSATAAGYASTAQLQELERQVRRRCCNSARRHGLYACLRGLCAW